MVSGIRREIALSALKQNTEELPEYTACLEGSFVDIRGTRPDLHDPDSANYPASRIFGPYVRTGPHDGIAYDSVRGVNWVSYRPGRVQDVLQARHFRVLGAPFGKGRCGGDARLRQVNRPQASAKRLGAPLRGIGPPKLARHFQAEPVQASSRNDNLKGGASTPK
jgi:hypothetical protein